MKKRVPKFSPVDSAGRWISILVICHLLACSGGQGEKNAADKAGKGGPVTVTTARTAVKNVPIKIEAIGRTEPSSSVAVKSRVEGEIVKIHFVEGQEVKTGDPLFTIDPRPFESQLRKAQADLAQNQAQLEHALKQVQRYSEVLHKGGVAAVEFDKIQATAATLKAAVKADEAAVDNVKLQLDYCRIKSPITGITGSLGLTLGNMVKTGDGEPPLVVINCIAPLHVLFSIPEKNLATIRKQMAVRKLRVEAEVPGARQDPETGELTLMENTVDSKTGSIQLRALFANEDKALWPGQYVDVGLILATHADALVVPAKAVQRGQTGAYVWIISEDERAGFREVTVQEEVDGEAIIQSGLKAGERVVLEGQFRLSPGVQVRIKDAPEDHPEKKA